VKSRHLVLAAAVWAAFATFAVWRSPIPGVNEPHYLCKAKHFRDGSWCTNDFFIASADVHCVFYTVMGPLTHLVSFDQSAWSGRILVQGLLAFGWVRLAQRLAPGSLATACSAAIFLALQATVNLSGEWLIGGVEAKGFAYAALLLAIAAACQESWIEAGIETGVAISFHPVVGGWGLVALAAAHFVGSASKHSVRVDSHRLGGPTCTWRTLVLSPILCLVFSLPGLIPAFAMMAARPSVDNALLADKIQVFSRLKHHLDPARFTTSGWWWYAGLLVAWLVLRRFTERSAAERFLTRFVLATLAVAVGGLVSGIWLRSPGLMKFYPFRLFDIFLPIAVALTVAGLFERLSRGIGSKRTTLARVAGCGVTVAALGWSIGAPGRTRNPCHWPTETWTDFQEACLWIDGATPPDAVFLTPLYNVGFKWYAQRAEYVTWKDCPQDAVGILEWNRRTKRVKRWVPRRSKGGISPVALAEIQEQTEVGYILTIGPPPAGIEPIYTNRSISVCAIRPARE
jgi:hypothetical protein